jgi:hypothetical protein
VVTVVPHVAGRTVERLSVLPSPLRTLSVVTMLGAVSGSVVLLNNQPADAGGHAETSATAAGGGRAALAASALTDRTSVLNSAAPATPRIELAAYHQELRSTAVLRLRAEKAAALRARRKAAATKAAEAEAARERRQAARKVAASRSARSNPKALAQIMLGEHGWGSGQFSCLESLWQKESGWNAQAANPSSGAYGIPQALPGAKMATAGSDWRTNPATQIEWGLKYIDQRYGTPCGAWGHSRATGWY